MEHLQVDYHTKLSLAQMEVKDMDTDEIRILTFRSLRGRTIKEMIRCANAMNYVGINVIPLLLHEQNN